MSSVLGLLSLDLAILHQIRPVPLVPLILLLIILLPVAFIFFVEQRQPLLGNITHSLEIDVDIGSVSLNIQLNVQESAMDKEFLTS